MTVYVEKGGPVTTIILSRPEVRNAVDREAAQELADVFRSFEIDKAARVAVFSGDQGQFCAGADLKKDRMSAIEQFDLSFEQAMANEFKHGLRSLEKEAGTGAARFAKGAGRHGHFGKPNPAKPERIARHQDTNNEAPRRKRTGYSKDHNKCFLKIIGFVNVGC
jgi:1,4-dihydroxy-2-naphthoyl-CoA synthase